MSWDFKQLKLQQTVLKSCKSKSHGFFNHIILRLKLETLPDIFVVVIFFWGGRASKISDYYTNDQAEVDDHK